jgi:hypothetical protein
MHRILWGTIWQKVPESKNALELKMAKGSELQKVPEFKKCFEPKNEEHKMNPYAANGVAESNRRRKGERRGIVRNVTVSLSEGKSAFFRFLSDNSTIDCKTGCWIWSHGKNAAGYAIISDPRKAPNRKSQPRAIVSRMVCQIANPDMPERYLARHRCDNPSCVNPDHLEPGTYLDNSNDKISRGRAAPVHGELNPRATLTLASATKIRNDTFTKTSVLANRFGVSEKVVCRIRSGGTWKCIASAPGDLM